MPTQALREMAADGPVHREVHDVLRLKTTYSLTTHGQELSELLDALPDWGHRRQEKLDGSAAGVLTHQAPFPTSPHPASARQPSDRPPPGSARRRALPSTPQKGGYRDR
ncbi:hypothetical protein SMICM17S_00191 [Streptomyces microflavus]